MPPLAGRKDELESAYMAQRCRDKELGLARCAEDASAQRALFEEEMRLLNEERATADAAAAHRELMSHLEQTRLAEQVKAGHAAHERSLRFSEEAHVAQKQLHEAQMHVSEERARARHELLGVRARGRPGRGGGARGWAAGAGTGGGAVSAAAAPKKATRPSGELSRK